MTKSLPSALIAGIALLTGTAAIAQSTAMKTTRTTVTTPAKATAAVTTQHNMTTVKTTARPAARTSGRMVTAKLANGKTVTYNCSLAGNKTKAACK